MKSDLASSIVAAIIGFIAAFFITNIFIPELENVSFTTLETEVSSDLSEPNDEVFNYRALNPTVEVYVGQCTEFSESGECLDNLDGSVESVEEEETTEDENTDEENTDEENTEDSGNSSEDSENTDENNTENQ